MNADDPRPAAQPVADAHPARRRHSRQRPRPAVLWLTAALGLSMMLAGRARAFGDLPRVAVVGFQPAADCDPRDRWIATALEQILAWRLQRSGLCELVPPGRVHAARRDLSADQPPPWPQVLRALGVRHQLTGTCSGPPEAARVQLRWLTLGSSQPAASVRLGPGPLFDLLNQATRWALGRLSAQRLDRRQLDRLLTRPCRNIGSLESFARAVLASRAGDLKATAARLDEATQFEDVFLPAQLMLTQIQSQVPGVPRDRAITNLRLLRRVASQQNDQTTVAIVLLTQGTLYHLRGVDKPAETLLLQAIEKARAVRGVYIELVALEALADLRSDRARRADDTGKHTAALQAALEAEQQALTLARRMGDTLAELTARRRLAELLHQLGQTERELAERQRVVELARSLGAARQIAIAQYELGRFYLRSGHPANALQAFEACLKHVPDNLKPQVQSQLAEAYASARRYPEAIAMLRKVADHLEQTGALRDQLACLLRLSELQQQAGQTDAVRKTLAEAVDLAHALGDPRETALREKLNKLGGRP